jgi:predicted Zn-dependent peptidase
MASVGATTREEVIRYWKERYVPAGFRILITGDRSRDDLEDVLAPFAAAFTVAEPPPRPDPLSWPGWGTWAAALPRERPAADSGMPGMGMGGGMPHGMGPERSAPSGGTLAVVVAAPDSLATSGTELEVLSRWLSDAAGPLGSLRESGFAVDFSVSRLPRTPRDMLEVRVKAAVGADPAGLLGQVLGGLREAVVGPDDARVESIQHAWEGERALNDQRLHYAAVFYGEALAAARGRLAESVAPSRVSGTAVRSAASALLANSADRTRAAWLGPRGPVERSPLPEAQPVPKVAKAAEFVDGPLGSLKTTLANGLVVGVLPEEGSDVFGIHLLVADRSLREPADAAGAADLLHRLLTGGTVLGGSRELAHRIGRSGWEVKPADSPAIPFDNRYHVPDFSYVRLEGPGEDLEEALAMLAEMVRRPAWDEQGWLAALAEHRAAIEADNRGAEKAEQLFLGALLGPDHPLSRPVSGPVGASAAEADVIRNFWGAWPQGYFSPPRLVLTVASPVGAAATLELVRDYFSGGPDSGPLRGPYPEPQPALELPVVDLGDAPQVTVFWGRIADVAEADRAAVLVAMDALSDRMTAVIREREGLAYRLGAGVRHVPGGSWVLSATVGTRPENAERVQELVAELVAELAAEPLPAEEVARLNARERRSRMLRGLSAASRAYRVGRALFEGPDSPLAVDEAAYAQVTPGQLQAAVAGYLVADDMVTVVTP